MKAKIYGDWQDGIGDGTGFRDVRGRKCGPFIVHRAIEPQFKRRPVWRVSLVSCGMALPHDFKRERLAMLAARRVIRLGFDWDAPLWKIKRWPLKKRQMVKAAVGIVA